MNPLDKIKEGIEKQNLDLVCEGYNTMTGQKLLIPPQSLDKKNDGKTAIRLFKDYLKQMIDKFEFEPTILDKPDIEGDIDDDNLLQPEDNNEENVNFNEITSAGDRIGLYGNKTVLISEQPKPDQIKANIRRDEAMGDHNVHRPPPKKYKVKCTDCENTFDTFITAGGQFGQKCPGCLRSTSRER